MHYFTGHWGRAGWAPLALVERDGPTVLITPTPVTEEVAADECLVYTSNRLGTLVDDHARGGGPGPATARCGTSAGSAVMTPSAGTSSQAVTFIDIESQVRRLRRAKDDDEVQLLRRAIAATEAAYQYAFDTLVEGVTEVDVRGMQAAAAAAVGETLGEFGTISIGAVGGAPRRRAARAGEVAILDVSVVVRGYHSDCAAASSSAGSLPRSSCGPIERVMHVLDYIERTARPGVSCRQLYQGGPRCWTASRAGRSRTTSGTASASTATRRRGSTRTGTTPCKQAMLSPSSRACTAAASGLESASNTTIWSRTTASCG